MFWSACLAYLQHRPAPPPSSIWSWKRGHVYSCSLCDSSKSFKTLPFSCLWKAVKFSSSPEKCLLKGFPTASNWEAVREDVGFGVKQIWDHHIEDILSIAYFEPFTFFFWYLKNSRLLLRKDQNRQLIVDLKYQREAWVRTNLESQFYFCRNVTKSTFIRGDKIAWVRNVLTSRWCLFPTKFAHHKIWPGPLDGVWLLGKQNSLVPFPREYVLSRTNTKEKWITLENWA